MQITFETITLLLSGVLSVASCITAIAALVSARNVSKSLALQQRRDEERKQVETIRNLVREEASIALGTFSRRKR